MYNYYMVIKIFLDELDDIEAEGAIGARAGGRKAPPQVYS
jgi:hypothetical protein